MDRYRCDFLLIALCELLESLEQFVVGMATGKQIVSFLTQFERIHHDSRQKQMNSVRRLDENTVPSESQTILPEAFITSIRKTTSKIQ